MKKLYIFLTLSFVLLSCSMPVVEAISEPEIPMVTHSEVMTIDFPTKKTVFVKFGTPTSKETFENIENWYYKLSEVTNSTTLGFSSGTGFIMQNPLNPYLNPIARSLITEQNQFTSLKSNTTTVETYVKFWFTNDTVIKWESFGVDFSRPRFNKEESISIQFAGEFQFFDSLESINIHSHISKLRNISTGINGPMSFEEVTNWLENHPDFQQAFLPRIEDLFKLYKTDSNLSKLLKKQKLVVWSESLGINGNITCLNFDNGFVEEKNKQSLNYFVPLVGLKK